MEKMLVPPWLQRVLATSFFNICQTHGAAARSECNRYCLDCNDGAFCFYCRSAYHKDHSVIQIRRSSYHDVVRVAEIQRVLDITGVQTYVINSARVLFLNERPQPKSIRGNATGSGASHNCEICSRSLLDPFRFCSLGCKLVRVKRNGDACFVRNGEKDEEEEEDESREGSQQEGFYPPATPSPSSSSHPPRRRKGIPRRAPFGA